MPRGIPMAPIMMIITAVLQMMNIEIETIIIQSIITIIRTVIIIIHPVVLFIDEIKVSMQLNASTDLYELNGIIILELSNDAILSIDELSHG